jgi:hypothetical protein
VNYFPFDPDPYQSAIALDDKRLRRIFTEAVQTLSVLQFVTTGVKGPYSKDTPIPPKLMQWLTADHENALWFAAWTTAMLLVLEQRFGLRVQDYVAVRKFATLRTLWRQEAPRPKTFVNLACSKEKGLDYTALKDTHLAYQRYVAHQLKQRPAVWTVHGAPPWMQQHIIVDTTDICV